MQSQDPSPAPTSPLVVAVVAASVAVAVLAGLALLVLAARNGSPTLLWIVLVPAGTVALGLFHYVLWGRSMMQQTEAEREAARRQEEQLPRW